MGAVTSHFECCLSRSEEQEGYCWREGHGIGPTDAYLREATEHFYDCSEGSRCHDILFEQARLKLEKGRLLTSFAYDELRSGISHASDDQPTLARTRSSELRRGKWVGTAFQRLPGSTEPPDVNELTKPCWYPGNGSGLQVRAKGYAKTRKKECALTSLAYGGMYECICCDAIRADTKIENILGRLVLPKHLPSVSGLLSESESAAGQEISWTAECPLPRILCINLMLPYTTGPNDPGCSFVAFFHIKPQVLRDLQSGYPPPCIRKFVDFCNGPAGKPGRNVDDPNRRLYTRRNGRVRADADPNLLKATAVCENIESVGLPSWMAPYNGKPVVITKSGYVVRENPEQGALPGEWLEIGVDVRQFNWLARRGLVNNKAIIMKAALHFGFMVQAVDEDTLPEGLLCDMHVCGVDLESDPIQIDNSV